MSRDALIVGVSAYQYLPSLAAPAQDAEAIAQRLQADGEFRVMRMPEIIQAGQSKVGTKTPVTMAELEAALVRLFKPKGNHAPHTALFYFSGHGLQKDAGIQEGYLATSDANPSAGFYGLSLFWLRRLLQESPVRQRIVLLDCCHSGELLNFLEADPGAHAGVDRLFMAASREYEAAYESLSGQYSVFTQALLDGLDPSRVANGTITNYALTDWVSKALKSEMQQPLFENSGSEIILTRCQGEPTVVKTELIPEVCPYRGLEFFDEIHADYFFGREHLTDHLLEKLRTGNFVAVVGASGSGKSSLIRAGLIHKLRQGQKFSGSDRWRVKLITPTDQPLKSLATAFVNPKASAVERAEQLRRAEVFLREGGTGLSQLVRASLMASDAQTHSRLVLIIDQFEEVFTLCQGPQAERDRHRFFNCLINALREAKDCLSIVIVLRADFFSKCSLYTGLAEQIEQHLVTVTPLTYEQIKASVVKPAQKVGLVCDPNLVYNILLDVVGAPGELPLLQYTLLELWQRRQPDPNGGPAHLTLDAYTELGGVRGTLQKRADEIFYNLTLEEQRVAKRIFIALTQLGEGTEDTRRRILKSELVSPRLPSELVERVLEKLVAAKLVVTNRVAPAGSYQERHDQGVTNLSTALRLVQLCRGKVSHQRTREALVSRVHTILNDDRELDRKDASALPAAHTANLAISSRAQPYHESVDVAHEALIRNWSLLRTWLDENREMLRRQRRIEHAAREWHNLNQPRAAEYLLNGDRLADAEDYLTTYPDDLSALAQRYIAVSREENRRAQKELRLLQLAVPCTLLVALAVTFNQYQAVVKSQAEKEYQMQVATSRQRAAIAQSILQDPDGDPNLALMISRLAVEQGGRTREAQDSLRAALQKLRLQANLSGHQGAVRQVVFSPNQYQLATAGEDGTIRLWSLKTQTPERVLKWDAGGGEQPQDSPSVPGTPTAPPITAIAFSPDGKQIAAIAQGAHVAQVWSVESGELLRKLDGFGQEVTKLAFSPKGTWIATASADNTVRIWNADTGLQYAQLSDAAEVRSLEFSPDGQMLLVAGGEMAQLWQTRTGRLQKSLHHPKRIDSAQFSPSGQWIATGCQDGNARIWRVQTGQLYQTLGLNQTPGATSGTAIAKPNLPGSTAATAVMQVLFSPDERVLATTTADQQVRLWNTQSGQLQARLNAMSGSSEDNYAIHPGTIAFSPDSQKIVTTSHSHIHQEFPYDIHLWDVKTGRAVDSFQGHTGLIEAVQFSADGTLLATASADGSTRLWSTESGGELPTLQVSGDPTQWIAFRPANSAESNLSAAKPETQSELPSSASGTMNHWATWKVGATSHSQIPSWPGVDEVITVTHEGTLRHWNLLQGAPLAGSIAKNPVPDDASSATLSQSSRSHVLTMLKRIGKAINFWKASAPQAPAQSSTAQSSTLATTPAPSRFLTTRASLLASADQAEKETGGKPSSIGNQPASAAIPASLIGKMGSGASLTGVAFSTDTTLIAAANQRGTVELWQANPDGSVSRLRQLEIPATEQPTQAKPSTLTTHLTKTQVFRHLVFSANHQTVLGVGDDWIIRVWDVQSGKLLRSLRGHEDTIAQAQFSPDGQLIVSASRDRTARIWEVSSGKLLTTLQHKDAVNSSRFSPDGHLIVTASQDGTAKVLEATTGNLRVILNRHRGAVLDAAFSPDGQMLVTAGEDGTARLWDAQTGIEQATLRPLGAEESLEKVKRAVFSPDGRLVATLGESGRLRLWAASWEGLLDLARDRTLRQLKPEECLRYLGLPRDVCPAL